jgi:heavy metal sensor kinase
MLVAVGAFAVTRLRSDLRGEIDQSLTSGAAQIARGYAAEGRKEFRDVTRTVFAPPLEGAVVQVLDANRRVILSEGGGVSRKPMLGPSLFGQALRGQVKSTVSLPDSPDPFRVVATGVQRHGQPQVVVAGRSLHGADESAKRLLVLLLIALPAALVVTAAGGWGLARKALLPVERMSSKADAIGIDQLAERVTVPPTKDEIAHLGTTLNAMLDRLELGVEEKRRLVGDASHELRTPLATMQAEIEVSLRGDDLPPNARQVLLSAREEVERMTRLVQNLLTLAQADEGRLHLDLQPVDLAQLARRVVQSLEPMASAAGVQIEVDGAETTVQGDAERLNQVVTNLVDNAAKHSGAGTRINVHAWQADGQGGLTVKDTGRGIPADQQERVFDRFSRLDKSRSRAGGGSGLGLAIAREIIAAHGGRIWVESTPGQGSSFSIQVPLVQSGA